MLVFRGWGLIGIVLPGLLGGAGYDAGRIIGCVIGTLIGCVAVWFIGRRLNAYENVHMLLWIPLQYWAFVAPPVLLVAALSSTSSAH